MSLSSHLKSPSTATFTFMAVVCVVGLIIIIILQRSSKQAELAASSAGQAFTSETPDTYTDTDGNVVSLSAMIGQPFMVTTWASWCPHCYADLETIDELLTDYPDLRVLAINRKESKAQVSRYLATQPDLERVELIIDTTDQFFSTVDGYTMPESLVFDETGKVVYHARGNINPIELRETLDEVLVTN